MRHLAQDEMVLYYYGEGEGAPELGRHLAECAACRQQFERLRLTLEAVQPPAVPEPGADYEQQVWRRIAPQLEAYRKPWWRSLGTLAVAPKWVAAGAMAALLLVAFFLGRWSQPVGQDAPQQVADNGQVRERVLFVAVGDHLDRSQMVLVELMHAPSGNADITMERRQADELVAANRLYRQTALQNGETGVAEVLEQLERVLIDVANGPAELTANDLAQLQKRIDSQGLLFKVRVLKSNVRGREPGPGAELDRS